MYDIRLQKVVMLLVHAKIHIYHGSHKRNFKFRNYFHIFYYSVTMFRITRNGSVRYNKKTIRLSILERSK